jgi:hypothetical protein
MPRGGYREIHTPQKLSPVEIERIQFLAAEIYKLRKELKSFPVNKTTMYRYIKKGVSTK